MSFYTDQSVMPFGKHKGLKLANVPAHYLIWLYESNMKDGPLKDYIKENLEALRMEAENDKNKQKGKSTFFR